MCHWKASTIVLYMFCVPIVFFFFFLLWTTSAEVVIIFTFTLNENKKCLLTYITFQFFRDFLCFPEDKGTTGNSSDVCLLQIINEMIPTQASYAYFKCLSKGLTCCKKNSDDFLSFDFFVCFYYKMK